jgi:hypothetical protein
MDASATLYKGQMIEVLRRFHAIDRILGAKKPRTTELAFDDEFMWLQIRKIVELVGFGGILADEERYASLRAMSAENPDYTRDWNVRQIMVELEKIAPDFLPMPIKDPTRVRDGHFHFDHAEVHETRARFVKIYERAGGYLHVPNPFADNKGAAIEELMKQSRARLLVDLKYLKEVLSHHAKIGLKFDKAVNKPADIAEARWIWIVTLNDPKPGQVRMMIAEGVDDQVGQDPPR